MSVIRFSPYDASKPWQLPRRGTPGSAGFDVFLSEEVLLQPGEKAKLCTNLQVVIPPGMVGWLVPRSSTHKLPLSVQTGIIDSDYRGEVRVMVEMDRGATEQLRLEANQSIAQLVVTPFCGLSVEDDEPVDPCSTKRGAGGFGSTGIGKRGTGKCDAHTQN